MVSQHYCKSKTKKTLIILTPEEFRTTYKHAPKTIKDALQQAYSLFPPPSPTHLKCYINYMAEVVGGCVLQNKGTLCMVFSVTHTIGEQFKLVI